MKFFSSDLHFGNKESLEMDSRPFKSSKNFEKFIIKTWNKQTNKNDEIWVVGDFVDYHENEICDWVRSLNLVKKFKAKINLIVGNNEERLIKNFFDNDFEKFKNYCLDLGFNSVGKDAYIEIENNKFYLTHKPKNHHKEILTLFGHSHRAMGVYKSFGFHIGCDLNHFKLFSEKDILHFLDMKNQYWDKDENLKLI